MNMVARDIPFLEEEDRPTIHAHWPDGQDEDKRLTGLAGQLDLTCNLVAHVGVEVGIVCADYGLELSVPPGLPAGRRGSRSGRQAINLAQVPAGREKALHHGTGQCSDEV